MSTIEHDLGPDDGAPVDHMRQKTTLRQKMAIMGQRNFIFYWLSGSISFLADNFIFIAMPLLIMALTGDAKTLGFVMAVGGIPRIVFTLFGGAISDRFSAIRVMLWSRIVFVLTNGVFALFLWDGSVTIIHIYVFSLVSGVVGSFLFPAQMALLPSLVRQPDLPPANAVNGGTQQIMQAFAPAIVGGTIAILSGYDLTSGADASVSIEQEMLAYAWAFGINSTMLALGTLLLIWIRPLQNETSEGGMLSNIMAGLRYIWNDAPLRAFMIYIALSQLFSMGAQMVGVPVMATARSAIWDIPGPALLGLIGTAGGIGAAIGSLTAGFLPVPGEREYGPIMISLAFFRGVALMGIGYFISLTGVLIMFGVFSLFMGYTMVLFNVWMQTRVEISMLGRAMSVVMMAAMGLSPISAAFAGWTIDLYSLELLFAGSGFFMILIAGGALAVPSMRLLGYRPEVARAMLAARRKSR